MSMIMNFLSTILNVILFFFSFSCFLLLPNIFLFYIALTFYLIFRILNAYYYYYVENRKHFNKIETVNVSILFEESFSGENFNIDIKGTIDNTYDIFVLSNYHLVITLGTLIGIVYYFYSKEIEKSYQKILDTRLMKGNTSLFRDETTVERIKILYIYNLTTLRISTFLFSSMLLIFGIIDNNSLKSDYFESILEFSEKDSEMIIRGLLIISGSIGIISTTFFFETILRRKVFYIPLSIINLLLGILYTKIFYGLLSGENFLINNMFFKLESNEKVKKTIIYIQDKLNGINEEQIIKNLQKVNEVNSNSIETVKESLRKNISMEESIGIVVSEKTQLLQQEVKVLKETLKEALKNNNEATAGNNILYDFFSNHWLLLVIIIGLPIGAYVYAYKTDVFTSIKNLFKAYGEKNEAVDKQLSSLSEQQESIVDALKDVDIHAQTNIRNLGDYTSTSIDSLHNAINILSEQTMRNKEMISTILENTEAISARVVELEAIIELNLQFMSEINLGQNTSVLIFQCLFYIKPSSKPHLTSVTLLGGGIGDIGSGKGNDEDDPLDPRSSQTFGHRDNTESSINIAELLERAKAAKVHGKKSHENLIKEHSELMEQCDTQFPLINSNTTKLTLTNRPSNSNTTTKLTLANSNTPPQNLTSMLDLVTYIKPRTRESIQPSFDILSLQKKSQNIRKLQQENEISTSQVSSATIEVTQAIRGNGPLVQLLTFITSHPFIASTMLVSGLGFTYYLIMHRPSNSSSANSLPAILPPNPTVVTVNVTNNLPADSTSNISTIIFNIFDYFRNPLFKFPFKKK